MKRLFALLLVLAMVLGLVPVQVFAAEGTETPPGQGKVISILGDSISTYSGYSNGAAAQTTNSTIGSGAIYYPRTGFDVTVDSTWWYQAAQALGMEILVNNSWSGSCLLNTRSGTVGAYVDRCVQLHDDTGDNAGQAPDVIAIFLGTNDYYTYPGTLGSFDGIDFDALIPGEGQYSTPTTSMEAYAIILDKISHTYPQAEVYCFTLLPRVNSTSQPTAFNADITKLAQRYGATVVDLYHCGISSEVGAFGVHMGDNLHPNSAGMDAMTNAFVSAVLKNSDQTTCDVAFELDQVLALEGTTRCVVAGQSFEAHLAGLIPDRSLNVRVQMGGVDVTEDCYADGKVSIPCVTGDVEITADLAERSPLDFHWQYDSQTDSLVSVTDGDAENKLTMTAGSITDGKFSKVKYTLEQAVVLKHDRPWALEWSSSGTWTDTTDGALLFAGSATSTTENAPYLYRRHNSDFIAFGVRSGSQYYNYGVSLKANGIDGTVPHVYRLENRIHEDGSNMVYLLVDGNELGPMNHHWTGGTDRNTTVDWLNGQDLVFTHMGTSPHTIGNCYIDYIRVWEAGEHDYEAAVTYPSKVTPGYTDYFCDHCAQGYRIDWLEADAYQGKTIACVGDSITAAVGVTKDETDYVTVLAQKLGMNYIRLGKSGTTLCTGGKPECNISRLTESNLKGADVVTILLGVNDFVQAAAGYYQLGDLSSTDTSTIYGAARMWCERIQELRQTDSLSHTQFYFMTPVITSWNNSVTKVRSWDQSKTNIHGYTLRDLCNAIVEVAALYDVPVIDLNLLSGLYYIDEENHNTDVFGGDGAHPGDQGHEKMAQAIAHRLLQNHLRTDHDHDFGTWVTTTWPTCFAGQEQQLCCVCSATQSRSIRQHEYEAVVTDPTCTVKGYTTYTCDCGDSYVDDYVEKLEHTPVTGFGIKANSVRPGATASSHCGTCGEVLAAEEEIPAKGYDWMLEDGEFKLLLIGNSFSQDASGCGFGMTESQLYHMLRAMLGDEVKVTLGLLYSGGKGVHWYATQTEQGTTAPGFYTITPEKTTWTSRGGTSTQTALTWTDWDVVTLQPYDVNFTKEQEGVPEKYKAETDEKFYPLETATEYMLDFIGLHAPQADVYCYMHWARSSATVASLNASLSTYQKFADFYPKGLDYLGTETGNRYAGIIPVGLSIQNARTTYLSTLSYNIGAAVDLKNDPQIGLQRDGGHVTFNVGRYIAGLTFAETIIPEALRADGYVLPEIRVTESVGKLPAEYTAIAQKAVRAAVDSWKNGSLAVTEIEGYTEDPTVAAKEKLETVLLMLTCADQESMQQQLRESLLAELPADFAVDAVAIDTETKTAAVTLRFGYTSVETTVSLEIEKHPFENGVCTSCGAVHPNLENYQGKVISILGDSISTFAGYIPVADGFNLEHLARYPQDNLLTDVNETWWMQVISTLGAKLGINDSWRGATVSGAKPVTTGSTGENAAMGNLQRIRNLGANGTPDVILFYGGTNDLAHVDKVGSFDAASAPTEVDLTTTKWDNLADGYVHTLLRLKHFYPEAQIVAMLPTYTKGYYSNEKLAQGNAVLAEICEHYGVAYVDLRDCGITTADLPDNIHPNAKGMDHITGAVLGVLASCEMKAGENVVYPVTHELSGATGSLGYYKGVSHGKPFVAQITGDDLTVKVIMGGVDITDEVYADGVITVAEVTGELVIFAQGVIKPVYEDHLQQLPENVCAKVNLWAVLEHDQQYYTVNGWDIHSSGTVYSVTFPVEMVDRIYATSFGSAGSNGSTINGIRVTWFDATGVLKSVGADAVYEEFAQKGYLTVPEGAVAVNIPMWKVSDSNELYILNRSHDYEEGACTGCGGSLPVVQGLRQTLQEENALGITWDALEGATKYWVYVNDAVYASTTGTEVRVTKRSPGQSYRIAVTAKLSDGTVLPLDLAEQITVTTRAQAKTEYTADTNSITLTWTADSDKTWIYLGTSPDSLKLMASSTGNSYTLKKLNPNATYYLRLSYLMGGKVVLSEEILTVKTASDQNLQVETQLEGDCLSLSWQPNGDSYKYWVILQIGDKTLIYSTTDTQFRLYSFDPTLCRVSVRGVNTTKVYDYEPIDLT